MQWWYIKDSELLVNKWRCFKLLMNQITDKLLYVVYLQSEESLYDL